MKKKIFIIFILLLLTGCVEKEIEYCEDSEKDENGNCPKKDETDKTDKTDKTDNPENPDNPEN